VAEDGQKVVPERVQRRRRKRRHPHLVDQVAEERGLGQDLDVEELADRLERDRLELLEPVQPAGRVDVDDRHGEQEPPEQPAGPPPDPRGERGPARADDVVAQVDRLEERVEVLGLPRFERRGHEHQRERRLAEP
jgi:hypothetical protein